MGLLLSLVLGSLYSWLGDKVWTYAVATMLFIFGTISLCMGLLGALEPPDGWATRKRAPGRRSLASQVANQRGENEEVSPYALAVWGVVVGAPMIALAIFLFSRSV